MIENKLENCATNATQLTLLERMRSKRHEAPITRESLAVSLPVVIDEKPIKLHLPSLVMQWISICTEIGFASQKLEKTEINRYSIINGL